MSGARAKIKICGVTRVEDATMVAAAGADYMGINFWPHSKRWVNLERGIAVAAAARAAAPTMGIVGVFVNQLPLGIVDIARRAGLDFVQLHGNESVRDCEEVASAGIDIIKAIAIGSADDVDRVGEFARCSMRLVDTPCAGYGGSGQTFDWSLARSIVGADQAVLLAGGLTPDNVGFAIRAVRPFGVDVASGVESAPGIKEAALVHHFIEAARAAAEQGAAEEDQR